MTGKVFALPACCSNCGLIFPSGLHVADYALATLRGNKQVCPRCGGLADVFEGTIQVLQDAVKVLRSDIALQVVRDQIAELASKAMRDDLPSAELTRKASEISPVLGKLSRDSEGKPYRKLFWMAVLMLSLESCTANIDLDINQLIEQLILKSHQQSQEQNYEKQLGPVEYGRMKQSRDHAQVESKPESSPEQTGGM